MRSILGEKYGRLVILKEKKGHRVTARCECGVTKDFNRSNILRGLTRSCGSYEHRSKLFEFEGQIKTVRQWAEHFGVTIETIRERLKRNKHVGKRDEQEYEQECKHYGYIDGERLSASEIVKRVDISRSTIIRRIRKGETKF